MQTVHNNVPAVAVAGLLYDTSPGQDIISRAVEGNFPAGVGVVMGTDLERQARVPAATGEITGVKFLGVTVLIQGREATTDTNVYSATDEASILRKGRIWVKVEEAIVAGTDTPFCRFASGAGGTQLGAWRKSADTATAVSPPNAKFLTSAAAQGFALLELA